MQAGQTEEYGQSTGWGGSENGEMAWGRRHLPCRPGDLTWDPLNLYESHPQ